MKRHVFRKRQILRFSCAICCVVLVLLFSCISENSSHLLYSQQAAQRWQGDSKEMTFAQVSAFLQPEAEFTTAGIQELHEEIQNQLKAASLQADSENTRLWYDCYSTQCGQTEIQGTRRKKAKALITAVGGDFFLLHELNLVSGNYFQKSDLMQDRVILDTALAWALFGSADVAGMEITIGQKTCFVAGVVTPETDYASQTAYGKTPRMYMSYTLYQALYQEESYSGASYQGAASQRGTTDTGTVIDCYEAVLPNPVRHFAENLLKKSFGVDAGGSMTEDTENQDQGQILILENTGRYSLSGRYQNLTHIRDFVISDTVTYPYWENAARIISFDTTVLLFFSILFSIYPVVYCLWLCWKAYRRVNAVLYQKRQAFQNRYRSEIKID